MGRGKKGRARQLGKGIGGVKRRAAAVTQLAPQHIVYCEGKTEKVCLEGLRQHFRLPSVTIEVFGQVGVPKTIVDRAHERLRERDDARVYAVFDCDSFACFDAAVARLEPIPTGPDSKTRGVFGGVSVPCFELWAILLHRDQTAHLERDDAQRALRKLDAKYDHEKNPVLEPASVLNGLDAARLRSEQLRQRALDAGDPYTNPTSTFSAVVDAIFGDAIAAAKS